MQRVSCLRYLGACATHTRTLAARSMATHATPMHTKRFHPVVSLSPEVHQYFEEAFGSEHLTQLLQHMPRPPLCCTIRVNTLRATAEDVLSILAEKLPIEDRAILGTRTPFVHPQLPNIICVPGAGPNSLNFQGYQEIVVSRKAGEAILRGAHVFAPGVLAVTKGLRAGDTVAVSIAMEIPGADSFGLTRGWALKPDSDPAGGRGTDRSDYYIAIGEAKMSRRNIAKTNAGVAVQISQRVYDIPGCAGIFGGRAGLQNLPSYVAALVVDPQPGSRVLDMCAAPGGKTCAMADLMHNDGVIIACDRTNDKVANIRTMASDFGATCIQPCRADATRLVLLTPELQALRDQAELDKNASREQPRQRRPQEPMSEKEIARRKRRIASAAACGDSPPKNCSLPEFMADAQGNASISVPDDEPAQFEAESFDYVLLDGPCSAMGIRPRLSQRTSLRELQQAARYQRLMLKQGVHLVKVGGVFVYSTCTMNPAENEANVRWLLDRWPQMRLVQQSPRLGGAGLTGGTMVPGLKGEPEMEHWLSEEESLLVQRFDPTADEDTIAFFIAKFVKFSHIDMHDLTA